MFSFCINLLLCLNKFESPSFRFIVRKKRCWDVKTSSPTPNSEAENSKKKKVSERRLRLSYTIPKNRSIIYKLIQRSSAVSSKCSEVFVLIISVENNSKKNKTIVLKSPKNKNYFVKLLYENLFETFSELDREEQDRTSISI